MTKCVKCKKRKAKRYCPALGSHLCSLCCGQLREKEIHCPEDCVYLKKHGAYQEKRKMDFQSSAAEHMPSPEKDILRDERLAWLALHIESPLGERAASDPSFSDKDALSSLEYARDKISQEKKLIFTPIPDLGPKNETGEKITDMLDRCRYEKKIVLPGETGGYSQDEKVKVLDRVILELKTWAGENMGRRAFLENILARFEKIRKLSRSKVVS